MGVSPHQQSSVTSCVGNNRRQNGERGALTARREPHAGEKKLIMAPWRGQDRRVAGCTVWRRGTCQHFHNLSSAASQSKVLNADARRFTQMHADGVRLNDLSGYVIGCVFTLLNTLGTGLLIRVDVNARPIEVRSAGLAQAAPGDQTRGSQSGNHTEPSACSA